MFREEEEEDEEEEEEDEEEEEEEEEQQQQQPFDMLKVFSPLQGPATNLDFPSVVFLS